MLAAFYVSAVVAVVATVMVIVSTNAVHGLLYLIVSLLSVAVVFYVLGAPFAAALEVIVYAGAIMVLFAFVVMMLNLGEVAARQEESWLRPWAWIGPGILSAILLGELVYVLWVGGGPAGAAVVGPAQVGAALFGPYVLAAELASMLLLAGLIGAYHLARRQVGAIPTVGEIVPARHPRGSGDPWASTPHFVPVDSRFRGNDEKRPESPP